MNKYNVKEKLLASEKICYGVLMWLETEDIKTDLFTEESFIVHYLAVEYVTSR